MAPVIHISEGDAARDFARLLAHVNSGGEVVIERGALPPIVMRAEPDLKGRRLSESIAMAKEHAKELGFTPVMDADFAADMKKIIDRRKPRDTSAWE